MDAIRASCGGFQKQPELHFNPTTMEVKMQTFNDKMRDAQNDPRIAKQHALKTRCPGRRPRKPSGLQTLN